MADENNEDDSWLYGSSNENQENQDEQPQIDEKTITDDPSVVEFENDTNQDDSRNDDYPDGGNEYQPEDSYLADSSADTEKVNGSSDVNGTVSEKHKNDDDDSDDDDDDDEDDIVVTIGDIQPASSFNIKQRSGNLLAPATATGQDKPKTNLGKFSIEEFESVGTISGQSAIEYNIEAIEDKPWRKPGADITDYFNYGFSEETWRSYCERQKRMRHESGAGLSGLGPNPLQNASSNSSANRILTSLTTSENSKYPAPGSTNTHNSQPNFSNRGFNAPPAPAKENVIQVMTAERREYSRPKGKFDVSMSMPPPNFNMSNEPFYPEDNFSYGYEPTQEQQWNDNVQVGWMPSGIKELTPGPQMLPPPHMNMSMPPPNAIMPPNLMNVPPQMVPPPPQHNINPMIGPPGMPPMMPPPVNVMNPSIPPNRGNEDHRNNQVMDKRNDSGPPPGWRTRDNRDNRDVREKERDYRDRERDEESPSERERRRERDRYRSDRERGSSRRERSRSRERSRRRSKSRSRERDRKSRDKKKSHKKDKDDSD